MNYHSKLKVATLQPHIRSLELKENLDYYRLFISHSFNKIEKYQIICFPEYWNGIKKSDFTVNKHEKSLDFLEELAAAYSIWIIGGSQIVHTSKGFYNRSHIFNPDGRIIGTYDKKNLFGFEKINSIIPGVNNFFWNIHDWKISIRICSDLWNTIDYSSLMKSELDLIFCPIMTTLPESTYTSYGRFLWYNLAVTRAKEAASIIVVSDIAMQQIRDPFWSAGASCIVNPAHRFTNTEPIGFRILKNLPDGKQGIVECQLDLDEIRDQRKYREDIGLLNNPSNKKKKKEKKIF